MVVAGEQDNKRRSSSAACINIRSTDTLAVGILLGQSTLLSSLILFSPSLSPSVDFKEPLCFLAHSVMAASPEKNASNGAKLPNGPRVSNMECPANHHKFTPPTINQHPQLPPNRKGDGGGVLAQMRLLRKLSKRPVPTEYGDGTYPKAITRPKLRDDLSRIGVKGM